MSWKKLKMGEFLINRENRFKPNDKSISGLKRIDKIDFSGKIFLSDKSSNTDMILVKKGDLVISGINVEKGAMSVYQGKEDVTATIHYSSYTFNEKKIDIDFLKLFLRSSEFKSALKEQVPGGIKTEIKPKHLLNLEVVIPNTVSEQKLLVNSFAELETHNLNLETELINQHNLLKQLHQSFLREAMQGKLVKHDKKEGSATDLLKKIRAEKEKLIAERKLKKEKELLPIKAEEIPFEIPENWVWCRLSDVCIQIVDCPHSTPKYLVNQTGYYGIDTTCIDDSGNIVRLRNLSKEGYQERIKRLIPTENDVVYAREGSIGLAAFIPKDKNICLGQRVMLFRASNGIDSRFLKMIVSEETYKKRLLDKHRGMGAKHVNVSDIVSSVVPLPPLKEQKRIVKKLGELMTLCDELKTTLNNNQNYTDQLLQVALKDALQPKEVEALTT